MTTEKLASRLPTKHFATPGTTWQARRTRVVVVVMVVVVVVGGGEVFISAFAVHHCEFPSLVSVEKAI